MQNEKFYMYKPLTSLENFVWLNNYINQKIWFSRLADLNDPFEGQFHYKPATPQEILERKPLRDWYKAIYPHLSEDEFIKLITGPEGNKIIGEAQLIDEFFKDHGVLCLTKSCKNIPMWAHYANNHTGYCVIFEIDKDEIHNILKKSSNGNDRCTSDLHNLWESVLYPRSMAEQEIILFNRLLEHPLKELIFTKVMYSHQRPELKQIDVVDMNLNKPNYEQNKFLAQHSFGVKFKQWEYENEYRLIANANSNSWGLTELRFYPFLKISGIIMGEKIGKNLQKDAKDFISTLEMAYGFKGNNLEDKVKEFITYSCHSAGIKSYMARCSSEEYHIEVKECEKIESVSNHSINIPENSTQKIKGVQILGDPHKLSE